MEAFWCIVSQTLMHKYLIGNQDRHPLLPTLALPSHKHSAFYGFVRVSHIILGLFSSHKWRVIPTSVTTAILATTNHPKKIWLSTVHIAEVYLKAGVLKIFAMNQTWISTISSLASYLNPRMASLNRLSLWILPVPN